ncbi:hypothetical protein QL285_039252 [Trifolium repens]|nr:hypothetical protein QL285_039252 [Trifolium repens]
MGPKAFLNLCTLLRDHGGLTHTRGASIEEQVEKFLHIVGHNVRNRVKSFFFRRSVPIELAPRYRGRKDYPTQNVLAACTFDLKFTYVLVGWEGTTSDSRIVKSALTRQYPHKVPQGKYYLADAGFPLKPCLITPFRGERYHLQEYSRNSPRNPLELVKQSKSASVQDIWAPLVEIGVEEDSLPHVYMNLVQ